MDKLIFKLLIAMALVFNGAAIVTAEDPASEPQAKGAEGAHGMDAEMQAKYEAFSTPNENHEVLKSLEGNWKAEVKMWMDPAAEPEVTQGTAESKMIHGDRFLEQKFSGTAMGQPFEGRGIVGFDNQKKEYRSVWLDNMSTGVMVSSGSYDPAAKTITEKGTMSCPIVQGDRDYRAVTTLIDKDHYTYESYMAGEDGKEMKTMLITYTRQ